VTYHTRIASGRKVPPLSNAGYVAIDNGNCSPRHMRITTCAPPVSKELQAQVGIPFALVTTPFAAEAVGEEPIPAVDMEGTPLRCSRCKGYINCSVGWADNGAVWVCNLCEMRNDVPAWYQCSLDGVGLRQDRLRRAELMRGSVDFLVNSDYSVRPLQQAVVVFGIDISRYSLSAGCTVAFLRGVKSSLAVLAGQSREGQDSVGGGMAQAASVRVGIFTFDSTSVQFFATKPGRPDAVKVLVAHASDPIAALPPDSWILPLDQSLEDLSQLLDRVPELLLQPDADSGGGGGGGGSQLHLNNNSNNSSNLSNSQRGCPAAAIKTAQLALETLGGRVVILTPCTPAEGFPKIHARERANLYGTENELNMYGATAANINASKDKDEKQALEDFATVAEDCCRSCVCVDVVLCPGADPSHRDSAVLGSLCDTTGGALHLVTGSLLDEANALRVQQQLVYLLRRTCGSEAVVKLRCSVGVRLERYVCKGSSSPGAEAQGEREFAGIDRDLTICCLLRFDGTLKDEDKVYVQLATLYTTSNQQRVVRVHNLCVSASNNPTVIFRNADLDAVTTTALKVAADRALTVPLNHAGNGPKTFLNDLALEVLYKYRINCSAQSPRGQLILPESLKLFPLYVLGMLKHPAFIENPENVALPGVAGPPSSSIRVPAVRAQERAYELRRLLSLPTHAAVNAIYPRLFRMDKMTREEKDAAAAAATAAADQDNVGEDAFMMPAPVPKPLSAETLSSDSVYLLDDGSTLFLYVGRNVAQAKIEVSGGFSQAVASPSLSLTLFLPLSRTPRTPTRSGLACCPTPGPQPLRFSPARQFRAAWPPPSRRFAPPRPASRSCASCGPTRRPRRRRCALACASSRTVSTVFCPTRTFSARSTRASSPSDEFLDVSSVVVDL
jgi:protein transport protein SEC24